MPRAAAFFDLDRTLISGASGYHWSRSATRAGLMKRRVLIEHAYRNVRFRMRGSTDGATDRVIGQLSEIVRDQQTAAFEALGPQVVEQVMRRVYPRAVAIARDHQAAGRPVYIATAAAQHTVDLIAARLGFDGAIGTRLEERDGLYTGAIEHFAYREGKADAMRVFAQSHDIALSSSYGYSDSESDLPMLEAVGYPVAVNPDRALAAIAAERGWEIVRFRRGRRPFAGGSPPT